MNKTNCRTTRPGCISSHVYLFKALRPSTLEELQSLYPLDLLETYDQYQELAILAAYFPTTVWNEGPGTSSDYQLSHLAVKSCPTLTVLFHSNTYSAKTIRINRRLSRGILRSFTSQECGFLTACSPRTKKLSDLSVRYQVVPGLKDDGQHHAESSPSNQQSVSSKPRRESPGTQALASEQTFVISQKPVRG